MGKSSKSTSKTSLPKWAQGYAKQGAGMIMDTVKGNQGHLDDMASDLRGYLPQMQQMAFGPNANLDAADGYAKDVLGGKYLNNNPHIEQMAGIAERNALNGVNSTFSSAGRTGGGNHAQRAAQGIADSGTALRFGNYSMERGNQQAMAGLMPSLSAARYQGIAPLLAATQTAGSLPYAGLGSLAGMGNLWAGQGTTTQTQKGSGIDQALQLASAAAMAFSDRRMKTNVELLRRDPDGLGWYRFAYKNAPDQMIEGVMADEVKELRPAAYVPNYKGSGFDGVNYAALGGAK